MQQVNQQAMQQKVAELAKNQPVIECSCGCSVFEQGAQLKRISHLLSGFPNDILAVDSVWYCKKCYKPYYLKGDVLQ